MSRIRGIETKIKVQKDVFQIQQGFKNGYANAIRKKSDDDSFDKDDAEKHQIDELLHKLPALDQIFEVHRKIGEGTFSSVYLGSLRRHSTLPAADRRWFAIKHLVPTAHPARIEHELRCLQDIGGKHNVIGVDLCLRHLDTIVFIMPYIPHRKFSEYVGEMDWEELRRYMRALLEALRHVHSFGIIHRDVKPSNFLYDRDNKRYLLVDFGLAQRVCVSPDEPAAPRPASDPAQDSAPTLAHSNKRTRDQLEDDSSPGAKRVALDLTVESKRVNVSTDLSKKLTGPSKVQLPKAVALKREAATCACACAGVGGVCAGGGCATRAVARAPRAGTQGFRPPEVLLKWPRQSAAVDLWAAGVVLATVLLNRYPLFRAADDVSALAEVTELLGTAAVQRAAHHLGRRVVTSVRRPGMCLRKLSAHLRGAAPPRPPSAPPRPPSAPPRPPCARCRRPAARCLCPDENVSASSFEAGKWVAGFPDSAFALAAHLLEPAPAQRPSAAAALSHAFLADPAPHTT
ncbi:cell division cycle 7-related protein kinase [Papilio machaon]|uniref:cell division cycle 7-related protein kinase n=1 Tax=Papilio machaon TaxID=76193 RepID=UPI001E6651F2|nr:cell division cycle 7-related protein kinase [Papilio machaon]